MNTLPKISVPNYSLTIPSNNIEITYRPYLIREEKVLLMAIESEDGKQMEKAIISIINECTNYKGDAIDLTSYDVEYIFIKLRSISVGETIDIIKICNECEHQNEVTLDLSKAVLVNNEKIDHIIKLTDEFSLELSHNSISDKLQFSDDESDTEVLIKSAAASLITIYNGDDVFDARDVSIEERIDFVEGLSSMQFNQVVDFILNTPYVHYKDTFVCTKCGHKRDFEYSGLMDFFI